MRQIVDANTLNVEPGCYVDGHWGWRGVVRQVLQFEGVAYELDDDDRVIIDSYSAICDMDLADAMVSLSDEAEEMLNNALRPGLVAHWHDGEFYVSPHCDDDIWCEDDTCYCHC